MKHSLSKRWRLILLILIPLLVSSACVPDGPRTGTQPPGEPVSVVVDFGPGALIFPDTKAGMADLASYKATLTLSFDGTRDGQPSQWSKTYVMLNTKEPVARQLTLEKTGDIPDLDAVFRAEMNGAAYERRGENACNAGVIDSENSLGETWEPAGFLTGVIGAEDAGAETVNDVAATHYTFDERALAQSDIAQSTGEMWVASEGGYILKYLVTTKGKADYFGKGVEGTLTGNYELTDVNQPVTFALPDDCPAGLIDAPLLPDASNILNMPSIMEYETSSSVTDVGAFYQEQIPTLGWTLTGEPTISDTLVALTYAQGSQKMTIITRADAGVTTVSILLEKAQE